MKLQIEQPYVDALINEFEELNCLADQLRFGNKVIVEIDKLNKSSLAYLQNLYKTAGPAMQNHAAQIATLHNAINDEGIRYKADDLEALVAGIAEYFIEDAIRG